MGGTRIEDEKIQKKTIVVWRVVNRVAGEWEDQGCDYRTVWQGIHEHRLDSFEYCTKQGRLA